MTEWAARPGSATRTQAASQSEGGPEVDLPPAKRGACGRSSLVGALLALLAPFWPLVALSVLLGFATVGSGIGLMAASAWIIASAALHPSVAVLQVAIVGVRFFGLARGLARYAERLVSHQVTFRVLARLRVRFYAALEPWAPARLMAERSGDLLSRAVADIGALENFYVRAVAPPVVAALVAAVMAAFLGRFDARLAWRLLALLALAGLGLTALSRWLSRQPGRDLVAARARLHATLVDGIQGLPELIAFRQQETQLAAVQALGRELSGAQIRLATIGGLSAALNTLMTGLAVLSLVILAIPLVRSGQIGGVNLAVLALAAAASFEAVLPLPLAGQHWESSLAAAGRILGIGDWRQGTDGEARPHPPSQATRDVEKAALTLMPASGPEPAARSQHPISVENLRFRYTPTGPLALDGVTFAIRAGGRVAVMGPSGAGKTSLINVLLRFWDYHEGRIELAGRELRAYAAEDVRRQIAVVAQSSYLFNATVRANLLLAEPEATQAELEQATRQAQIHDFIASLPQGYDTWIGEQGLHLSGGERQRLAIARAYLKAAPILLLDEATANLDPATERAVLLALETLMAGRTTLMITHRPAGIETADEIIVLRAGRVAERGAHAELLAAGGLYRRMWELQPQFL